MGLQGLVFLCLLVTTAVGGALDRHAFLQQYSEQPHLFSSRPQPGQHCGEVPLHAENLTTAEQQLLPFICWPEEGAEPLAAPPTAEPSRGIPYGVNCTAVQWCNDDICTEVCQHGSVVVEPWLAHAIKQQVKLVQTLPLCYATLLGTHNSAITLADGYGNLDNYFKGFFKYIKWAVHDFRDAPLRTNNQLLSLTDQLNLGVRAVELDTHWVGNAMRIAHCGGLHVPVLNKLVDALNFVARILHRSIQWDTETAGCVPSLSSIPTLEQRLLTDALQEVKDWMDEPRNTDEFLVLYFDDQPDLQAWGVVSTLLSDILSVFPRSWIFTAQDRQAAGEAWPSQQEMLLMGKRLLLVSGSDYGDDMHPLIFARSQLLCGWNEPSLALVDGVPNCQVNPVGGIEPRPLFDGILTRVISCELQYGPLNCDFVWRGSNYPVFDEVTLPPVMGCGLNMPCPDSLTPDRAAAAIWTWAPGHPFDPGYELEGQGPVGPTSASSAAQLAAVVQASSSSSRGGGAAECGVITAGDSRWRAVPCSLPAVPSACRLVNASLDAPDGSWVVDASLPYGSCPEGAEFDIPRHPRENYLLAAALQQSGHEAAWLPVHGPDWSTQGWPAARQHRQPFKRQQLLKLGVPAAGSVLAMLLVAAGFVGVRSMLARLNAPPLLYQALAHEPA